jgi:hypothetical protein
VKNVNYRILLHVAGCLTFLFLPILFSPFDQTLLESFQNPFEMRDFMSHVLMIIFFYFHLLVLLPRFFEQKKYLPYISFLIISLFIITATPNVIYPHRNDHHRKPDDRRHTMKEFPTAEPGRPFPPPAENHPPPPRNFQLLHHIGHNLWMFLLMVFFSLYLHSMYRRREIQREKLKAELSYLKAQINPHFLFNTLNSIYGTALTEKSPQTAEAILKLSGLMRYVLLDDQEEFVSLQRELSFISDFIELQKIRLGDTVNINYNSSGDPGELRIAPLILITFIENAFKHGVNPEEKSEIAISIRITDGAVELKVDNTKVNYFNPDRGIGSLGLTNTHKRLDLYYPRKHILQIDDTSVRFTVKLNMQLQ